MNDMYYYGDSFFSEVDDIIDSATEYFKTESDIPQDFSIEYEDCELQPIFKLDSGLLYELIHDHFEENSTEEGNEWDGVQKLIEKHLNFEDINADAPELFFPNGDKHIISRDSIILNIEERGGFS